MQSSLKLTCYRQSITHISIVMPDKHTTKVLFRSFYNLKQTFYYFNATVGIKLYQVKCKGQDCARLIGLCLFNFHKINQQITVTHISTILRLNFVDFDKPAQRKRCEFSKSYVGAAMTTIHLISYSTSPAVQPQL